ncbi:neutral/alkaline non-lysosomal ceramidase N-terminal domain-containing protein [Rhodopirellula sp. JC639]|uniref:neutral/alkaline non-lysosomal ceramidase N-terminal domain-containing protein n=1 Tax=Stieleria mannarensis TaxID=2755585 RepID=UPI0016016EB9|nr:neutral/alkaline non-lysosomal ceramidase N-terminal domain-containing protein [Rhodopirellula sp. JC639]
MLRCYLLSTTLLLLIAVPTRADEGWQAGIAKRNITPSESMWMAGYGSRDHPSQGKLTDLWAKALVLRDAAGKHAVLITLDLVGIDRELATAISDQIQAKHQLDRSQIAICCSHTHTGPALKNNLAPLHYLIVAPEQQRKIETYQQQLQASVIDAVDSAFADQQPAKLSWGSGKATFATNRRENRPEGNVPQWRREDKLKGPVDHDVPVLAVRDSKDQLVGVVFGYACHATVLGIYSWSGDYPGFACAALEASHPDAIAMFWAGCGADQNPLPRRTVELAKHYGQRLASAVDAVLMTVQMQAVTPTLTTRFREIDLPLATLPLRDEIEANSRSTNQWEVARATMLLDQLDRGQALPQTYPYAVGSWKMGDQVDMVFLGGEVVVDYALRLKSELRGTQSWIAGYANDVMAYIPSRRVLREGGYEGGTSMVYYGLPAHWSPEIERHIVDEVHRQVD